MTSLRTSQRLHSESDELWPAHRVLAHRCLAFPPMMRPSQVGINRALKSVMEAKMNTESKKAAKLVAVLEEMLEFAWDKETEMALEDAREELALALEAVGA